MDRQRVARELKTIARLVVGTRYITLGPRANEAKIAKRLAPAFQVYLEEVGGQYSMRFKPFRKVGCVLIPTTKASFDMGVVKPKIDYDRENGITIDYDIKAGNERSSAQVKMPVLSGGKVPIPKYGYELSSLGRALKDVLSEGVSEFSEDSVIADRKEVFEKITPAQVKEFLAQVRVHAKATKKDVDPDKLFVKQMTSGVQSFGITDWKDHSDDSSSELERLFREDVRKNRYQLGHYLNRDGTWIEDAVVFGLKHGWHGMLVPKVRGYFG